MLILEKVPSSFIKETVGRGWYRIQEGDERKNAAVIYTLSSVLII